MNKRIPKTEKKFIEEILSILDREPESINPMAENGLQCLYVKRKEDSSARVASNCVIGKWLILKGFDLSGYRFIIEPAGSIFIDFLEEDDHSCLSSVANQIQDIADNNGNPLPWRKVASLVRDFYKKELEMETV